MKVINTIAELRSELDACRALGKSIERAVAENDITVVSIFVNPTQFNDKNDLKNYPRTLDADCALLEEVGATYAFVPEVAEMYPEPDTRVFSFSPLDTVMEGACRPGHFNGVAQIVSKLFYAVEPHKAYFGEKDFQQLAIIREMVRQLNLNLEIIGCPIVREDDGLAMSSRNMLLTAEERVRAVNISRILKESRDYANEHTLQETRRFVEEQIAAIDGFIPEYFQIVDGNTLQQIESWEDSDYRVGCIALFCGKIRLIDNITYIL